MKKLISKMTVVSTLLLFSAIILSSCSSHGKVETGNTETLPKDDAVVTSNDVPDSDTHEDSDTTDKVFEDYSNQINENGNGYELDGRVSDFPIVIGEHEHLDCGDTDAELMMLGQERFESVTKLYRVMRGLVPTDSSKVIYDEYGSEIYALDEEFGTYESIMELCNNTFAPEASEWRGYYSVERPEELLDSGFVGFEVDGEYNAPTPITEALGKAMRVEDGITYKTVYGGYDSHILQTKIIGVMNHTDTHIEYRLCTMVLDESNEALAVSEEEPQVFFEHSVMKLELIDGKWLVTQIRDDLGNEVERNEVFMADNGLGF